MNTFSSYTNPVGQNSVTDKLTHHELTAEWVDDKQGRAIMLTQPADNYDDPGSVLVHPWQLRAVCEQFGIIASDPQAEKTIATLKRRMVLLRDRIGYLHNYLVNHSDHRHADLSYEVTYATACFDLAEEFCAEFAPNDADETRGAATAPLAKTNAKKKSPPGVPLSALMTVNPAAPQLDPANDGNYP